MKHYLLVIEDDIQPVLHGPFRNSAERDEMAREHRRGDPVKDDGLYKLDVDGVVEDEFLLEFTTFSGGALEDDDASED